MRKTIVCLLALVLVLTSSGMAAFAAQPDRTYTYEEDSPVPSTNAYQVMIVVDEATMGTTRMKDARDIYVDKDDQVFVLDSGNSRVLILDQNYHCIKELKEFKYGEEILTLATDADGIFFREETENMYIADTSNNRVLVSDLDGNVSKIFTMPKDELLKEGTLFKPKKVIVDNMGIMYVTSGSINTGALMIDSANNFLGFYGTNKLKETAAMKVERMWRKILKQAVTEVTFQPVSFNNIFWSEDRFVYTVSPLVESVATPVSKLNALGNNVFPQAIDLYTLTKTRKINNTILTDITVDDEGAFTIIDSNSGHLFQYDEGWNLTARTG